MDTPFCEIAVSPDAADNGLANMLADLLRQNLAAHPERVPAFRRLHGRVSIEAIDAEVGATLEFARGSLRVRGGTDDSAAIRVRADSERILALCSVPVSPGGVPQFLSKPGRSVVAQILDGRLRIRGLLLHPVLGTGLVAQFSV